MKEVTISERQKNARVRYEKIKAAIETGVQPKKACLDNQMSPSNYYQLRLRIEGAGKKKLTRPRMTVVNIPHHPGPDSSEDEVNIVIIKGHAGTISAIMANLAKAIGNG